MSRVHGPTLKRSCFSHIGQSTWLRNSFSRTSSPSCGARIAAHGSPRASIVWMHGASTTTASASFSSE